MFEVRSVYLFVSLLNDVVGHLLELALLKIAKDRCGRAWSTVLDAAGDQGCCFVHLCEK